MNFLAVSVFFSGQMAKLPVELNKKFTTSEIID